MEAHAKRRKEVTIAAHQREPAIRTPSPMSNDWINEAGNADAVKQIADEASASDHRPGGDGRAGIGKGELEYPDCQERHTGGFVCRRCALEEEPVVANEPVSM